MNKLFNKSSTKNTKLSQDDLGILFFIAALIFGSWFRIYPAFQAGFPINDGGLFLIMTEAIQNKDYIETIDAIGDILVVVHGLAARIGCDSDTCMELVHKSNMSKFCVSEEEALQTVAWYEKEFREGRTVYDSPAYKLAPDGKRTINSEILKKVIQDKE